MWVSSSGDDWAGIDENAAGAEELGAPGVRIDLVDVVVLWDDQGTRTAGGRPVDCSIRMRYSSTFRKLASNYG